MTSATTTLRERLRTLHEGPRRTILHLLAGVIHLTVVVLCVVAWEFGLWPLSVILWFVIAWLDHAGLTRLHESAHRMLFHSPALNELAGILIGTLALTPLSVYRYVHTQHHAHLGREKDPEFWPYNQPGAPRWLRLIYAWLELTAGWIFTPWLYSIRTARAWQSLNFQLRKRLIIEWVVLAGFWTGVLLIVVSTHTWKWFLVGHLAPTWIAGSVQTIRKFTEHLGRFGDNIYEMTRTVEYTRPVGRAASHSQLHVEHHGTHHRWPKSPSPKLPEATQITFHEESQGHTYPNHLVAIWEMLPYLADPKLGPQWKTANASKVGS
jgi:fatty acid desaturase